MMGKSSSASVLVIGFGNECRGDDGIGPFVARQIEALKLHNAQVLIVHQLTPELAERISTVEQVFFVDACHADGRLPIVIERIHADEANSLDTHISDAGTLLALSTILYGSAPPAWMVSIQGLEFEAGAGLSEVGKERAIEAAKRTLALFNADFARLRESLAQFGQAEQD